MSGLVRYAITSMVLVGIVAGALSWFLDRPGRTGVLLAAGIACSVQLVAFALLERARRRAEGFFFWWGAGIALRICVVIAVGIVSTAWGATHPAPLLLSLAGFLFLLVLIEPIFLGRGPVGARSAA